MSVDIGTVLDALVSLLVDDASLYGVNVYSGIVTADEAGLECIAFGNGTLAQIDFSIGTDAQCEETWTIGGEVYVAPHSWEGTIEETISASRERALTVLKALKDCIRDNYLSAYPSIRLTSAELEGTIGPDGRMYRIPFELTIELLTDS